ncbi:MAG: phosphatidate cytidylyltransferase [Defluviitaleaceae bacterium]|nr:phosphatidate cytidylyltransferase [Defluviitaleaceae bacterium]
MLKRIITSVIGLPILAAFLFFGGWALAVPVLLIALLGQVELYRCFGKLKAVHFAALAASTIFIFSLLFFWDFLYIYLQNYVFIIIGAFLLVISVGSKMHNAAFSFLYITLPLSAILVMREGFGLHYVWLIFIGAWGSDTGAYFVGKFLGKRKLAPTLSPNKTVEGSIGGIVLAAVLSVMYALVFDFSYASLALFGIYGAIAAVLGQSGDLFASAIKRRMGIKDFGGVMPGHGGVLDRFDSILFVAVFAIAYFHFLGM